MYSGRYSGGGGGGGGGALCRRAGDVPYPPRLNGFGAVAEKRRRRRRFGGVFFVLSRFLGTLTTPTNCTCAHPVPFERLDNLPVHDGHGAAVGREGVRNRRRPRFRHPRRARFQERRQVQNFGFVWYYRFFFFRKGNPAFRVCNRDWLGIAHRDAFTRTRLAGFRDRRGVVPFPAVTRYLRGLLETVHHVFRNTGRRVRRCLPAIREISVRVRLGPAGNARRDRNPWRADSVDDGRGDTKSGARSTPSSRQMRKSHHPRLLSGPSPVGNSGPYASKGQHARRRHQTRVG